MTYTLAIGDRSYSSWSLRGWLLLEKFGLPAKLEEARLYTDAFPRLLERYAPSRTVPALRIGKTVIWDSLAIAEELASRHPDAGHWPADPAARAVARSLVGEMHSGFGALRSHCPMNLRVSYSDCAAPAAVLDDVARFEALWAHARASAPGPGPWLCGAYSVADAFFAPIAARIAGYGLEVGAPAQAYVDAHLADPVFRAWRAAGLSEGPDQPLYRRDYPQRPWPDPKS